MPINLNQLGSNKSAAAVAYHTELYHRSLDTCAIYNPSEGDFIVWNDRKVSHEKWLVPNKDKDIGFGKGTAHVPFYIATRYCDQMGLRMIHKKIEADWAVRKEQYRENERGEIEQRMALKSNNPALWNEVLPVLYLGVVKRYGGEEVEEEAQPLEEVPQGSGSAALDAMNRLGIAEKEVGVVIQQQKDDLASQIG